VAHRSADVLGAARQHLDGDHLELCWGPDGQLNFYPETLDPERLARRLVEMVALLNERPRLIRCAAGACDGNCGHGG